MSVSRLAFSLTASFLLSLALLTPSTDAAASSNERSNAWSRAEYPANGPARVVGGVAHGCIAGAAELPPDGPGYEAIRLSRHRNFGHPDLVAYLERLGRRAEAAGLPVFYVG